MNPGDYVLIQRPGGGGQPGMHAVGRVGVGAAEILGPSADPTRVTLDLCQFGEHLPQTYRVTECAPAIDLATHGLCERCRGWGLRVAPVDADFGELLHPPIENQCPTCTGSGRLGLGESAPDTITCEPCRRGYTEP